MLLYADDMVVWGHSKEELQKKLTIVINMMQKLGLQISTEKSELQFNQYEKNRKNLEVPVHTVQGTLTFRYTEQEKSIRYPGSWCNMDQTDTEGLTKLKAKVKERLTRIEKLRVPCTTKALLIKARVLSIIHYTAETQEIKDEQLVQWEKDIYRILSQGQGKLRKDMVYKEENKWGMGMTNVLEEYKINRVRGIVQMAKTEDILEGRGQLAWVQRMIIQDLQAEDPCMGIVKESKEFIGNTFHLQAEETSNRHKPWSRQETLDKHRNMQTDKQGMGEKKINLQKGSDMEVVVMQIKGQ